MSRGAGYDTSDPRSIVTPEAFEISTSLLGLPIAPPGRRLAAILVDGALIVLLTRAGGLLLGIAAVLFFFRMAAGRSDRTRSPGLGRAFRAAVGCFGGVVLLVTGCSLWLVFGPGGGPGNIEREIRQAVEGEVPPSADLEDVFGGIGEVQAYRRAPTADSVVAAATRVARRLSRIGAPRPDISEALEELAPVQSPWEDEVDDVVRRAMAELDRPPPAGGPVGSAGDAPAVVGEEPSDTAAEQGPAAGEDAPVDSLTLPGALRRYASLYEQEPDILQPGPDADTSEARRLQDRLVGEIGRDTLAALDERITDETDEREDAERRLEQTRQQLQEAREAGILGWLRRLADDLGLAFGWGTLYMTIFLSWWNGQTPGKKLLGIRVVQLDDSPMTWWEAFERGGGYAAGFATGLLGFAQVYWDPNRQAIHDKIAETVVLVDGAEPVPGPWRVKDPGSRP